MAGVEPDAVGDAAMRQRNPGGGGYRRKCGHIGNDLEGHARFGQRDCLLAPTPEDVRVAALQPDDVEAVARKLDEQLIDLFLRVELPRVKSAKTRDEYERQCRKLRQRWGAEIYGQSDADAVTRRTTDGEQRWPLDVSLSVERKGAQIVVKTPDDDELRFTSQVLAMNGAKP